MDVFAAIKERICTVCSELLPASAREPGWFDAVTVEPPRDPEHGDMASNAAMVLSKRAEMNPRALAERIVAGIRGADGVEAVEIAGPGFINLRLAPALWTAQVAEILRQGAEYGASPRGANAAPVNVEYVSANPTGPMHIGHARGAVVGDALANLLQKAGYRVTREYYINDAGAQVHALARSAYLRYQEACGRGVDSAAMQYPGDYLVQVGHALEAEYGGKLLDADEDAWLPEVRAFTLAAMMRMIRQDLADLGIAHDVFTSERSLHDAGAVAATLEALQAQELIYRGVLEPPKGKTPEDWEPREQTLFRTTRYGDDSDRALRKSDGSWTYFAADVAYARDKLNRGFSTQVLVLGADHGGYVKRMEAAVSAISGGTARIGILLCQLVKFMDRGAPIKMSKRAGTFTTVRDVIEAVGRDVIRFIMLTRKPEQPLDFDLSKVTEQSRENPVFYVQYAHARCHSVLRAAAEELPEALAASAQPTTAQLALLTHEAELSLIRHLASWPRVVEAAAAAFEPHRIAYFLQELAARFHGLWNTGNDDLTLRFLQKDAINVSIARLALARATAAVLASGLHVLGVEPLEELR
jgi:arginyl-tRNA synthetase